MRFEPNNQLDKAIALVNSGNARDALTIFEALLKQQPNNWTKINTANCYIKLNTDPLAEKLLNEIVNSEDNNLKILLGVSQLAIKIFRFNLAHKACEKANQIKPHTPEVMAEYIRAKNEARHREGIEQLANEMAKLLPDNAWPLNELGNYYLAKGDFSNASIYYEKSIITDPNLTYSYFGFAKANKFKILPVDYFRKLEKCIKYTTVEEDKARLLFAKAKVENDIGEYESAWDNAQKANNLKATLRPFNPNNYVKYIEKIKSTYSVKSSNISENLGEHVWIVGMPRSGTTLIEQILSDDSSLYPGGETPAIDYSLYTQLKGMSYLDKNLSVDALNSIGLEYEAFFKRFSNFKGSKIIDKVPFNYLHIGIFKKLFSRGKVVNFVRSKFDVATSIFFENFSLMQNYTHNIDDIFLAYDCYQDLMLHWEKLYPESILNIRYDKFITQHGEMKQKIIDFCGLKIDEKSHHSISENMIETPSAWQARQKLYSSAIDRWKNYPQMMEIVANYKGTP